MHSQDFDWQEKGTRGVHQFRLCQYKHGVHHKVHQLLRSTDLNASLHPRGKCGTFMMTGNIFTSQSTGLGGKTALPLLYSHGVNICCPQVMGKAQGSCGWRQWQEHPADRAAGLDTGLSSLNGPTDPARCSL